jgi:hypothetical protein
MIGFLEWLHGATWLWLPFLIGFLVQGLHCSPHAKLILYKLILYYSILAIALELLVPVSHLALRTLLFDLITRGFLFIATAEMLWFAWSIWRTGMYQHQSLPDEEVSPGQIIWYTVSAFLFLVWAMAGVAFAFTVVPGM